MRFTLLLLPSLFLVFVFTPGYSQSKKGSYQYSMDLTNVTDDKLQVELTAPKITKEEIVFSFPKMVPGTYAIEDYGRFISDFHAVDKKGADLPAQKISDNEWKISRASRLFKIRYRVEDTYDTKLPGPTIFQPAGTNIEDGKNYVINTEGFFGYFQDLKDTEFDVTIIRNKDFYGSTGLIAEKTGELIPVARTEKTPPSSDKRMDRYKVENYDRLVDSPLMYAKPDTAIINVGNTEVLIASYAPNAKVNAKQIANTVKDVLMAQKEYLGGKLPVDKYAFIFYFTDQPVTSYGALEHSYSSFYYMPESTIDEMEQQMRDFVAHEFFHIVTPLSIHSEQIQNFNFNAPEMSKHLWLYEGVTEYFAGNVQVQYGLITPDQYLKVLRQKMLIADNFLDTVPFTDISKFTLDQYKDQYYNVYQKGALIGLCLDLQLRSLSHGKYGMRNLIFDLSKKFGKTHAFQDDLLFDEIAKLTYPEINEFLKRYVGGAERLPLKEILGLAGVSYLPEKTVREVSLGLTNKAIGVKEVNGKQMLTVANVGALDNQGKVLNFQAEDALVKMNGEELPPVGPELGGFFGRQRAGLVEGKTVSYTVLRKNDAGELKEVELKAPVEKIEIKQAHLLSFDETADAEKLLVRKSWLTAE
jgi:predicted metalloprotease with PDZ domain